MLLLISIPAYAKSYICRADGSVVAFESGDETQVVQPLRQYQIEEAPLPPKAESRPKNKPPKNAKSDFVPLTQKEVEER